MQPRNVRPALWPLAHRLVVHLKAMVLGLLLSGSLTATAGAQNVHFRPLKVRGAASITASARANASNLEIQGAVTDDAGHPLNQAELRVVLRDASGKSMALPNASKCPPTSRVELSRGSSESPDAYAMKTDATGAFCLRVDGTFGAGKVELNLEDFRGLFEPASKVIEIDATRRSLVLSFSPQPVRLNLAQAKHTLFVDTKLNPPPPPRTRAEAIQLELLLGEGDGPLNRIASSTVQPGDRSQFDVPSNQLGAPGRATLAVAFSGSENLQPATAQVVVSRTAQVELTLAESSDLQTWAPGTTLPVAVGSISGAVPSGSVEARVMGRTVGIAPVLAGAANVQVRVESSRRQQVAVTLHYLPDAPWWIPGPALEAQVMTVTPSGWSQWAWFALAALVTGWTVWAWRRPRRRSPKETPQTQLPPGKPTLQMIRQISPNSGWSGRVIDAHDGHPIAAAELQILGPSFREAGVLRTTASSADGSFTLDPIPTPWPEGSVLRVSGVYHATFEQSLPLEGELAIHLTTRRRALLQRLARWAKNRGTPYSSLPDPTPGEVASAALAHQEPTVGEWAHEIESAAYGPAPPSVDTEQALIKREPG